MTVRHMGISSHPLDLMHITMLKLVEGIGRCPKASTYFCFPKISPPPPASMALVATGFGFLFQNKRDEIFSHFIPKRVTRQCKTDISKQKQKIVANIPVFICIPFQADWAVSLFGMAIGTLSSPFDLS